MSRSPKEMKEGLQKLKAEIDQTLEQISVSDEAAAGSDDAAAGPGRQEEEPATPAAGSEDAAAEPVRQEEKPATPAEEPETSDAAATPASASSVGPDDVAQPPATSSPRPFYDALAALEAELDQHPQGMTGVLTFDTPRPLPEEARAGATDGLYRRGDGRWEFRVHDGAVLAAVRDDMVHFVVAKEAAAVVDYI